MPTSVPPPITDGSVLAIIVVGVVLSVGAVAMVCCVVRTRALARTPRPDDAERRMWLGEETLVETV